MTSFSKKVFSSFDHYLNEADSLKNDLHFVVREGIDFSRKAKKLSFKDTIMLILSMAGKPIQEELFDYFDFSKITPTASAFVQARSKITPFAFQYLFNALNHSFPACNTYKGYRLIAVDGSELQIPTDMNDFDTLRTSGSAEKFLSCYHINVIYDILNDRYLDMILQGIRNKNEMMAMWTMINRFNDLNTIFIADRNYPTWNNMAHIIEAGKHFLIRCKDIHSRSSILKNSNLPNEEFDLDLSITLTTKQSKIIKEQSENYRFLSTTSTFDFMNDKTPFYNISFRAVRFKLNGSQEYESIVTNLNRDEFSLEEIKEIYGKRWKVEISFRHLKYSTSLCAIHSRKRQNIKQEIWARMILYNLSFIFVHHITKDCMTKKNNKRKYSYTVNITRAIHHCRRYIQKRKRKGGRPPDLEAYISNETLPIRPVRKNQRNVRAHRVVCFNYRFS